MTYNQPTLSNIIYIYIYNIECLSTLKMPAKFHYISSWPLMLLDANSAEKSPSAVGMGLFKANPIARVEEVEFEEEPEDVPKRPFDVLFSWVDELNIPRDSYELMYRMGQKTEKYFQTKVEYFAPYLLKDGMVQRMVQYSSNEEDAEQIKRKLPLRSMIGGQDE